MPTAQLPLMMLQSSKSLVLINRSFMNKYQKFASIANMTTMKTIHARAMSNPIPFSKKQTQRYDDLENIAQTMPTRLNGRATKEPIQQQAHCTQIDSIPVIRPAIHNPSLSDLFDWGV
jgi:hypothetical protein